MTNSLRKRNRVDYDDLPVSSKVVLAITTTLLTVFVGGPALMLLSGLLFPVGLGFWASCAIMYLAKWVYSILAYDVTARKWSV